MKEQDLEESKYWQGLIQQLENIKCSVDNGNSQAMFVANRKAQGSVDPWDGDLKANLQFDLGYMATPEYMHFCVYPMKQEPYGSYKSVADDIPF